MSRDYPVPLKLNVESVLDYIISRGGKVYNTELVKYFKPFLTDPGNKGKMSIETLL